MAKPIILVLVGASGVGKDFILSAFRRSVSFKIKTPISTTTRAPREHEQNGIHYRFVTEDAFHELIAADHMIEYAKVQGHWYGVQKSDFIPTDDTTDVIVKVLDHQGARTVKDTMDKVVVVGVLPRSLDRLHHQMRVRGDTEANIALRMETVDADIHHTVDVSDYLIVNDNTSSVVLVEQLSSIVAVSKLRRDWSDVKTFNRSVFVQRLVG